MRRTERKSKYFYEHKSGLRSVSLVVCGRRLCVTVSCLTDKGVIKHRCFWRTERKSKYFYEHKSGLRSVSLVVCGRRLCVTVSCLTDKGVIKHRCFYFIGNFAPYKAKPSGDRTAAEWNCVAVAAYRRRRISQAGFFVLTGSIVPCKIKCSGEIAVYGLWWMRGTVTLRRR